MGFDVSFTGPKKTRMLVELKWKLGIIYGKEGFPLSVNFVYADKWFKAKGRWNYVVNLIK